MITALASPLQCLHQRPGRYEPKWTQQDSHTGRWWAHKIYTKHQRTPRKQPKQCNNWIVYPRGIMIPDLSSIPTRHKQQSNRETSASSHIWWSCGWMTKSSEIPWYPLCQNADLQKTCGNKSARKVCQSRRPWLQRVLNNATSSYCIKVWCSGSLWTRPHNNGTDKSAKAGQSAEQSNASHTQNY